MSRAHFIPKEISMARIQSAIRNFLAEEKGAALAEYAILLAFIAIVCIVAVTFLGTRISSRFASYGNAIS